MLNTILNILTLGIKPVCEKQFKFHHLIAEFRTVLEHSVSENQIKNTDIETLYAKLDTFNYSFLLFSKHYKKYLANLKHLKPELDGAYPDVALLRVAVSENKWKPTKPFDIFVHHIKYRYKLTSKPYIAFEKKQNKKKLNAPTITAKAPEDPNKSNKWIRVPIGRHQCGQESGSCGCNHH